MGEGGLAVRQEGGLLHICVQGAQCLIIGLCLLFEISEISSGYFFQSIDVPTNIQCVMHIERKLH